LSERKSTTIDQAQAPVADLPAPESAIDGGDGESRRAPTGDGAVRGAALILTAKIGAQVVGIVSMAIVARILMPEDYGLVAMVLSATAFLTVFNDLGLSLVTVQRPKISDAQLSALFWINVCFGVGLAVITAAASPLIAWFFRDDRLIVASVVMGLMYPLGALGTQHQALLKRNMLFRRLAMTRVFASIVGAAVAVVLAVLGQGYWALIGQALATPAAETIGAWICNPWKPGSTRGCEGLRSLIGFGGRLTGHGLLGYFTNSFDKLLLGRFAGQEMLGVYSIAYRLMMRTINLAGYSVGESAISAMSRVAGRGRNPRPTFRRMLSLSALLGIPVCLVGVAWPTDVVLVVLGERWREAIPVVQLLFLAAMARLLTASTGWVFVSSGRPDRMLRWQMAWAPTVAVACLIGLPRGAVGVATAYLIANWLALVPCFTFCFRGTEYTLGDVWRATFPAASCALVACGAATLLSFAPGLHLEPGAARLTIRAVIAAVIFLVTAALFVPLAREGVHRVLGRLRAAPAVPQIGVQTEELPRS
jgi:PST family polysaccharide transporter